VDLLQLRRPSNQRTFGSTKESDAWKLLKKRHAEIAAGKPVGPDIEKTTFEDMATMLTNDYKANGRRSLNRVEDAIGHLRGFFGDSKAVEITSDRITAYVTARQEEKAASSTINTELAALSRMFVLAIRAGKAATRPYIAKLALNNTRKGFFEFDQFQAVLQYPPEDLKLVAITAYVTGWRVHDEILTRQKHHLDLNTGWLRLDPGETKTTRGVCSRLMLSRCCAKPGAAGSKNGSLADLRRRDYPVAVPPGRQADQDLSALLDDGMR